MTERTPSTTAVSNPRGVRAPRDGRAPLVALAATALAGVAGCSANEPAEPGWRRPPAYEIVTDRSALELPADALGWARFVDGGSGVAASFRLVGASSSGATREDDAVRYPGAGPTGGDLSLRVVGDGLEDHVGFPARPDEEVLRYELALDESVAALRLVGGVLELLDDGGAPRLRVARAFVVDARSRRHPARLSVAGCAVDADPRPPWGRALRAPGAGVCTVEVRWGGVGELPYPIVVDPAWEPTGDLAEGRAQHAMALLDDGRVMVAGGDVAGGVPTASAELFDEATKTWAATGTMSEARSSPGLAALADGGAIVVGGSLDGTTATATLERWQPATGLFEAAGALDEPRTSVATVRLAGGAVLVADGWTPPVSPPPTFATTYLYDPEGGGGTGALTAGPVLATPRIDAAYVALADGGALAAGGDDDTSTNFYLSSAERLDASLAAWTPVADMPGPRCATQGLALPGGDVVLVNGLSQGLLTAQSAYRFDVAAGTWSESAAAQTGRFGAVAARLGDERVVVAGGFTHLGSVEILDLASSTFSAGPKLGTWRELARATRLASGGVLVAGGNGPGGPLASGEVLGLGAAGASCTDDIECSSKHCVGGLCCDSVCDAPCFSCSAADKGGGTDGVCEPVLAGTADPAGTCPSEQDCGRTGACDGEGACQMTAAGEACAGDCPLGDGACDGEGVCVCPGASCAADGKTFGDVDCSPYRCDDAGCKTACSSSTECVAPYLCDRTGHCAPATQAPASDDAGCSVIGPTGDAGGPGAAAVVAVGLAAGLLRRARRRARDVDPTRAPHGSERARTPGGAIRGAALGRADGTCVAERSGAKRL